MLIQKLYYRHRRLNLIMVLAALALAALACGTAAAPTATPVPPTPVPPTPVPPTAVPPTAIPPTAIPPTAEPTTGGESAPAPSSLGGGVSFLDVVNETSIPICYLYVAPSTSDEWGDNQLQPGNMIDGGSTFTLTDIPPDTYDLLAQDCSSNGVAQEFGVEFTADGITWTLSSNTVELVLVNESSVTLCYLYVSPSTSDDWGPDQFGDDTIVDPGGTFTLTGIEPGQYDMLVESCDGQSLEEYGLDLSQNFTYTITD